MSLANYTGDAIKDWALVIAGTALIALLAWGFLTMLAKSEVGKAIGLFAGGVICALFIYMPDTAVGLLKAIASGIGS